MARQVSIQRWHCYGRPPVSTSAWEATYPAYMLCYSRTSVVFTLVWGERQAKSIKAFLTPSRSRPRKTFGRKNSSTKPAPVRRRSLPTPFSPQNPAHTHRVRVPRLIYLGGARLCSTSHMFLYFLRHGYVYHMHNKLTPHPHRWSYWWYVAIRLRYKQAGHQTVCPELSTDYSTCPYARL